MYKRQSEGGAKALVENLASMGVDVLDLEASTIRAVVHLHITDEDIDRAIVAFDAAQCPVSIQYALGQRVACESPQP